MDTITSSDQRLMIERLLQNNDFLDPINIVDPSDYAHSGMTTANSAVRSPTNDGFFSSNTMETILPPCSPTTPSQPVRFFWKRFFLKEKSRQSCFVSKAYKLYVKKKCHGDKNC